ncbi:MAG TPA: DNA translocase FtsK [Pararhizobium sp.]|nr:DNA translocase FtsK [Pararhizobium sp.]
MIETGTSAFFAGRRGHYGLPTIVRRPLSGAVGLAIFGALGLAVLSLSSWNVADPSFSQATSAPPTNALGFPGAIFADIAMQFFGLASVIGLMPGILWGVFLFRDSYVDRKLKRTAFWLLGTVLAAAVLGCLPVPKSWPLPSGLGGVLGDMVLKLPSLVLGGYPHGTVAAVFAIVLAVPAIWCLCFGAGVTGRLDEADWLRETEDEDDDSGEDEEDGFVAFGLLAHWWLTGRAHMRRVSGVFGRGKADEADYEEPYDFNEDDFTPLGTPPTRREHQGRVEPSFADGRDTAVAPEVMIDRDRVRPVERRQSPRHEEPVFDDDGYGDDDDFDAPQPVHMDQRPRVAAPAPRPQPAAAPRRVIQTGPSNARGFALPAVALLAEAKSVKKDPSLSTEVLERNARRLEGVLEDFGVKGEIIHVRPGPVVTLYELEPAPGIKSSRVIGLADDIARSMSAIAARVAVVPGRNAIGIELPNQSRETVYLRELVASRDFETSKARLALSLGKTIGGEPVIADLAKMPHLLVAGTTGSGKSVAINTMILSLIYRLPPEKCRLIMIDPKMLELSVYDGIPHLLSPVVTDPKKAVVALKWTVREMEDRYKKMSKIGVRNIDGFNSRVEQALKKGDAITRTVQTGFDRDTGEAVYETEEFDLEPMPYIVVIIDEMADLMMVAGKDIEGAVQRLAQMARAAGIHVIMATQRPSVDVITGTIKANFPTRISFQVTSKIDSRTILGEQGAEQLLGMGDMLYMAGGGRIQRVHGPFVSDTEVEEIVAYLKTQGVPEYLDAITEEDEDGDSDGGGGPAGTGNLADSEDPYDQAVAVVLRDGKASTSYIQRRLGIGYNRAASLIERMEQEGVIGPANHAGKREILVPTEDDIDPR